MKKALVENVSKVPTIVAAGSRALSSKIPYVTDEERLKTKIMVNRQKAIELRAKSDDKLEQAAEEDSEELLNIAEELLDKATEIDLLVAELEKDLAVMSAEIDLRLKRNQ